MTAEWIQNFHKHLICEEKSPNTIAKYIRDVTTLMEWLGSKELSKTVVLDYKHQLAERYQAASVNSIISSLNSFFSFNKWSALHIKTVKRQKQVFSDKNKELTKSEYMRLLQVAKSNKRLYYLMQTICATGIRVSEVKFITAAAVQAGQAAIVCKGKMRTVFLPKQLCKILKGYIKEQKIKSGAVFVTKTGKPLDRSNIWADMKKLCADAGVEPCKVFPHNLRHLFARTYYSLQKDIVRLADILGHSRIETTRIYTMESGDIHCRQIQKLGLVMRC